MVRVPKLWPGDTVVCMATGPSANQADADFLRGRARVIAINFAYELAPWADVLYSSDRQWWPKVKGAPTFQGLKFGVGSAISKANPFQGLPDVHVLRNTGYDRLEVDPGGLRTGRNSGYAAINLAYHFGAARIILLGYNMNAHGARIHYYEERNGFRAMPSLYPNWIRSFATLVEPLRAAGVEIINCTEQTSLTCFPCAPLREVFSASEVAA